MFREPEEISRDQALAKLDQIAATRRSTIRRESTVRPVRSASSRSLLDRIRESRRDAGNSTSIISSRSQRDGLRDIHDLDAELARLRRQRQRARAGIVEREPSRRHDSDYPRPQPEPRSDIDIELLSRLSGDPGSNPHLDDLHADLAFEVLFPDNTEIVSQHLPRPSRESGLRFEVAATSQSDSEQPHPYRGDVSRPGRTASPPGGRRPRWSHPHVSAHSDDLRTPSEYSPHRDPHRFDRVPADGPIITHALESLEVPYPPLHRVNHISPRPLGGTASRLDGLGDRMRSPSPTRDEPFEENWSHLLEPIEPGQSSTATSFMSSRPESRNGSNRSSQATQATTVATSFGEIGADDSCDLDLPSGITEEDVREIRARHGRLPRDTVSQAQRPDELINATLQRNLSRGNDRILELEVFGVILDRMQRREEIPDEWWAAVGLSPDVVRGNA
jgi:hypothetical protein